MGAMKAQKTTTERGLGNVHQKARKSALRALQEGAPCPFCGLGMFRSQDLDLDHSIPRALGGTKGDRLAHRSCNRAAGARLGNQRRAAARAASVRTLRTSRVW